MACLETLLRQNASSHTHLWPRQILGVRVGLAGVNALGFREAPPKKRLLVISETDGCFVDGLSAATACAVGHRTLRLEDYGKVAATFVRVDNGRAVRVAPGLNLRERAFAYAPGEARPYFAQLRAYQLMPEEELLSIQEVGLKTPVERMMSRPGLRVNCSGCGEEIINERGVQRDGLTLCRPCAGDGYYRPALVYTFKISPFAFKEPGLRG